MKRLFSLLLALALAGSVLLLPAQAADPVTAQSSAQLLYDLGLFRGTGTKPDGSPEFDLDRAPTRAEAVTMLVRLLGAEGEATKTVQPTPFTDVPDWARPYVGYAYKQGLTNGISADQFGSDNPVTAAQYLTFVLRSLGYQDGTDFFWSTAWTLTDNLGITAGEYNENSKFLRGDAAVVSAKALTAQRKTGNQNLLEYLTANKVITDKNLVVWGCAIVDAQKGYTSFLFYPVKGSPGTFTSFKVDKVTVNGVACQTLQVTTPQAVSQYLSSIGVSSGGFGYIEVTFDQAAATAAAKEFFTDSSGKRQPWLVFRFNTTGVRTDKVTVKDDFVIYQAPV